jgi:hypothetical protein
MRTLLPRNVPPDARGRSMRRASGTVLLAGGLLLTAGAAPGTAQTVTPRFDDLRAEAHRGETVYVTDHAGTTVKGRVVSISATSIELLVKDGSREWRVTDVAWITQRHRHAGRGALAGLALGAVLGRTGTMTGVVVMTRRWRCFSPACSGASAAVWVRQSARRPDQSTCSTLRPVVRQRMCWHPS